MYDQFYPGQIVSYKRRPTPYDSETKIYQVEILSLTTKRARIVYVEHPNVKRIVRLSSLEIINGI